MTWKIINTGKRNAFENMELDSALLEDMEHMDQPILHLYDWTSDSVTYGYFLNPYQFLNKDAIEKKGLQLARRPTGGGIVFHISDLAFSVLIPASHPRFSLNPMENYAFINQKVLLTIQRFIERQGKIALGCLDVELLATDLDPLDNSCLNFCMAKPTKYDVMLWGRKVGGAAQRKTKFGYLHQGTISLGMLPDQYFSEILKPQTRILEGMKRNTFPLLGMEWTTQHLEQARNVLQTFLQEIMCE
jgi:lipoate-protein ligase A